MRKCGLYRVWFAVLFFCSVGADQGLVFAQQGQYQVYAVAFYNLENLFDTQDDPHNTGDDEYTPKGTLRWTDEKYEKKLTNMSYAISQIAREHSPVGPAVLGVAEIENRQVLEDLVARPSMADMHYQIVHYESPDRRGIDVALLYNPALFQVRSSKVYPYIDPESPGYTTRDQLLVSGMMAGEKMHIIVAHWPSRYGGSKSSPRREFAASISRHIMDSLYQDDPKAKVILMGDLNDDPNDKSVREVLGAKKKKADVQATGLYNPMWPLFDKGIGSLAYQGRWNLFDQIIISSGLLQEDRSTLTFWKAEVFNRPFLVDQEGRLGRLNRSNKGYPLRTFIENTFINGYSDHFPTLIYLVKKI